MPHRMLIADDDPRVRAALLGLFGETPGIGPVTAAATRNEAYASDGAMEPHVVLADVRLPTEDDGLWLICALAARGRAVVAMSAIPGLAPAARAAGASEFVEKHAGPDALLSAVRVVLARSAVAALPGR